MIAHARRLRVACRVACLLLLLGTLPSGAAAETCPDAVLDDERAYFGANLGPNRCGAQGATCEQTLFLRPGAVRSAVCEAGRWRERPDPTNGTDNLASCPRVVLANGEIFRGGVYASNVCDAAGAPLCVSTYFQRLPTGGSGFTEAVCTGGTWQAAPTSRSSLRRVTAAGDLAAYLRRGLFETYSSNAWYLYGPWATVGGPSGGPSGGGSGGPAPTEVPVSGTNVQESGVDEPDRVKTDGDLLFVLRNGQSRIEPTAGAGRVRVVDIDPVRAEASSLTDIDPGLPEGHWPNGLHLRPDHELLAVNAQRFAYGWGFWYSPLAWLAGSSSLSFVDVRVPSAPALLDTLEIDGELISNRRIGNHLYLALRYHPLVEGLDVFADDGAEAQALIDAATLTDLLPKYSSRSDPTRRMLVRPTDCYLPPEGATPAADVVAVVAVDLETRAITASKCFVGASETLYVSPRSMYLASTRSSYTLIPGDDGEPRIDYSRPDVKTEVHKFALVAGGIDYRGSGEIDGHLGWNVLRKPFRLSEHGDDLRAITYTAELTPDTSPVAVTVLRDNGRGALEPLARLPNAARPEPIGKPGETLYATRFVGDHAYLVTFRVIDPLYVVDLSDPADPKLAGELEVTGFSDYLHPVSDRYLLGVGLDALPVADTPRGAIPLGVKIALYDVSDPARPFEADQIVLGGRGSSTNVLWDHRGFTWLREEDGELRFSLGVTLYTDRPTGGVQWDHSGLYMFSVDEDAGALVKEGALRASEASVGSFTFGDDRAVLAGDAVFYVHGDDVYAAFWSDPASFSGPR